MLAKLSENQYLVTCLIDLQTAKDQYLRETITGIHPALTKYPSSYPAIVIFHADGAEYVTRLEIKSFEAVWLEMALEEMRSHIPKHPAVQIRL